MIASKPKINERQWRILALVKQYKEMSAIRIRDRMLPHADSVIYRDLKVLVEEGYLEKFKKDELFWFRWSGKDRELETKNL